jgi:hypothetical protein
MISDNCQLIEIRSDGTNVVWGYFADFILDEKLLEIAEDSLFHELRKDELRMWPDEDNFLDPPANLMTTSLKAMIPQLGTF